MTVPASHQKHPPQSPIHPFSPALPDHHQITDNQILQRGRLNETKAGGHADHGTAHGDDAARRLLVRGEDDLQIIEQ
ncbi:MAG: hypothetical protein HQL97_16055 [Magnetococcales bacterium]|nr:hypothetical protein [Magnetococcales bacterium]